MLRCDFLKGDFGPSASSYELREIFQVLGHHDGAGGFGLCGEDHITVKCRRRRRWVAAAPSCCPKLGGSAQSSRVDREVTKECFQRIEPGDRLLEVLMEKFPRQ